MASAVIVQLDPSYLLLLARTTHIFLSKFLLKLQAILILNPVSCLQYLQKLSSHFFVTASYYPAMNCKNQLLQTF